MHPVTDSGLSSISVYLPKGIWYDFYTYVKYEGGSHSISVNDDTVRIMFFKNTRLVSK